NNAVLNSISGLSSLTDYAGILEISGNDALPNLDGLEHLHTLVGNGSYYGYALYVYDNDAMTNVDGLYGLISTNGGAFYVTGNAALCNTEASGLRDHIGTANITNTGYYGT